VYADPSVAPVLATGTRVPGTDNTPRELSAREVEVLQLVADGQSNKEIGEALNLSALTVKSHLSVSDGSSAPETGRRWSLWRCEPALSASSSRPRQGSADGTSCSPRRGGQDTD